MAGNFREIYSVWNWEKGLYDYYQSKAPRPYHARMASYGGKGLGETPESTATTLPYGAKKLGQGTKAIGTVAQKQKIPGTVVVCVALAGLWFMK